MTRSLLAGLALAMACFPAHAAPAVAAGGAHNLAIDADGTVRSWGDDSSGALGIGRSLATPSPTAVAVFGRLVVVAVVARLGGGAEGQDGQESGKRNGSAHGLGPLGEWPPERAVA